MRQGAILLHEFITTNREEIIMRCKARMSKRAAPRPTEAQLDAGVPLFIDEIAEVVRLRLSPTPAMAESAKTHGADLLRRGFTVAQVVHDYGDVCQTITELALETQAPITAQEFKTFNLCLDEAIAGAMTEYARLHESESEERLGRLAHEMGAALNGAMLAYDLPQSGKIGIGGSTGAVLGRSLRELRDLIGHELADMRIGSGVYHRERVAVRDLIEDAEVASTMDANARSLQFAAVSVSRDVVVDADRQVLASVITILTKNALRFTAAGGLVTLTVRTPVGRVLIDVEDHCGGLAPGIAETLLDRQGEPGSERAAAQLGLSICEKGARESGGTLSVRDIPGVGCVFTLDLPRAASLEVSPKAAA